MTDRQDWLGSLAILVAGLAASAVAAALTASGPSSEPVELRRSLAP